MEWRGSDSISRMDSARSKQSNSLIEDHEEKYQLALPLSYLDHKATRKVAGLEKEYDRAMVVLDRYNHNQANVIVACKEEVRTLPVTNHKRFSAAGLEHGTSNICIMQKLVPKRLQG